jgi:hypothetical protein
MLRNLSSYQIKFLLHRSHDTSEFDNVSISERCMTAVSN